MSDIIDIVEGEILQESHQFNSIYDELLWEVSHDNPDYIDPAVAAKAIMVVVNEKWADYCYSHRSSVAEFSKAMQWLGSSLLIDNHEYIQTTIDQRRETMTVKTFKWATYNTPVAEITTRTRGKYENY